MGRWPIGAVGNLELEDLSVLGFGYLGAEILLGGSWVVISGVVSPLIWVISVVTLLIIPLITTHEPPSNLGCKTPATITRYL